MLTDGHERGRVGTDLQPIEANPVLGPVSKDKQLKSLILAQIERWRHG